MTDRHEEKSVTIPRPFSTHPPRPRLPHRSSNLLIASGLVVVWGCGDTLDQLEGGGGPTFTSIYGDLQPLCSECHAPGAPGRTADIEATQDWSSRDRALTALRGTARGLTGNFAGCNGVPLLGASAEQSLLVASLDFDVRMNFSSSSFPDCTGDSIADQNDKLMEPLSAGVLQDLKDWIDAGAPGN
jgi:hypothetical protein